MRIHGKLRIPGDLLGSPTAQVRLRLVDIGRADAPATVLAESTLALADQAGTGEAEAEAEVSLSLDFSSGDRDPQGTLALTAHVDVDGSGELASGDLITTGDVGVGPLDDDRVFDVPLTRIP